MSGLPDSISTEREFEYIQIAAEEVELAHEEVLRNLATFLFILFL